MKHCKKNLCLLLTFLLAFTFIQANAYPKTKTIYTETFEGRNVGDILTSMGWIKDNAGTGQYTVEKDPVNKDNLCAYVTIESNGEMYVRKNTGSGVLETLIVEFNFYVNTNGSMATFTVLGNKEGGVINGSLLNLTFNKNGYIYLNDVQLAKYNMKRWYNIKVEADAQSDLCSIYIDGVCIAREKEFINAAKATEITRIRFNPFRNDVGFYFDDLVMSTSFMSICTQVDKDYSNVKVNDGMIYVRDMGAFPNDEEDDSVAIYRAISAAMEKGPGVGVKFDPGKYLFDSGWIGDYDRIISVDYADGLKLLGDNTEFIINDPFLGGIRIGNSRNVEINGISIDYSTVPWTQGNVVNVNKEDCSFDYKVMDGYEGMLNDIRMDAYKGFAMILDKDNPSLLKKNANDHFNIDRWEQLDENLYRMYPSDSYKNVIKTQLSVGDCVTSNVRKVAGSAFMFTRNENCSIKNCNVYAANNTIFVATYLNGTTRIENLNAVKREGSDRWIVSNADGVHVQGSRGPIEVMNCTFEGISDDCLNIYNKPAYISSVESDNVIVVKHEQQVPLVGETIRIYDINTGKVRGESKILSSKIVDGTTPNLTAKLTLETPIEGMKSGGSYKTGDEVFSIEAQAPGTIIKKCKFINSRRFGCYLKSVDTIIENCVFENLGGSAIYIENDLSSFWEGPTVRNIEIRNNIISNTPYRDEYKMRDAGAAIEILANKLTGRANGAVHENIILTGNAINSAGNKIMYASNVKKLLFSNNVIDVEEQEAYGSSVGTIKIEDSEDVLISDNLITDMRNGVKYAFCVDDYSENISFKNNIVNIPASAKELIEGTTIDIFIPRSKNDIVIDGSLDEWNESFEFVVNSNNAVKQFSDGWNSNDLSYKGKLLWDEKYLYVAMIATDDVHNQNFLGADIWQGDSLQIAVDPDRSSRPGNFGYTELGFALNSEGYDVSSIFAKLENKSSEMASQFKCLRNENNKTTVYEIALPWNSLLLNGNTANVGRIIGFSALINDSDDGLRKGWMEYFGGIGSGKRPVDYGVAMLVENVGDIIENTSFDDVPGIQEEKSINKLLKQNIISRSPDGKFYPDNVITRAEFLSMIVKSCKFKMTKYNGGLTDVKKGDWYADIVQSAFDSGVLDLNMILLGQIEPNGKLTIGDACSLICRAFEFSYSNDDDDWRLPYIATCKDLGIIASNVSPDSPCKRSLAAEMIVKSIELAGEN